MNERIIGLMNQANDNVGFTFTMDQAKPVHDLMEKFAELIVKDCRDMFVVGSVSWNLLNERLKHFGVEE